MLLVNKTISTPKMSWSQTAVAKVGISRSDWAFLSLFCTFVLRVRERMRVSPRNGEKNKKIKAAKRCTEYWQFTGLFLFINFLSKDGWQLSTTFLKKKLSTTFMDPYFISMST